MTAQAEAAVPRTSRTMSRVISVRHLPFERPSLPALLAPRGIVGQRRQDGAGVGVGAVRPMTPGPVLCFIT